MDWTDDAIVLGARKQGEGSLIVSLLARAQGRHRGLVRGGAKSRQRGLYEPGNIVVARWNARLSEHLGQLNLDAVKNIAALVMDDPLRLACLEAATSLVELSLPERAAHPAAYDALAQLLNRLAEDDGYAVAHLLFEMTLLAELGYGLDLGSCAVTGSTEDLAYVSPRTGRAVSKHAAGQYQDRLLILPRLLGGCGESGDAEDLRNGLALTGFFLERNLLAPVNATLPPARKRYGDRLARLGVDAIY